MKNLIKSCFGTVGLKISRIQSPATRRVYDAYESQRHLFTMWNRSPQCIFDVGAHYGETSVRYSQLFPASRIDAFEPYPKAFQRLKENTSASPNVRCHNFAIGESQTNQILFVNALDATNSVYPRPVCGKPYYPRAAITEEKITVKTTTIDALMSELGQSFVDILKMDIQGAELKALEGARDVLNRELVGLVYLEVMFIEKYDAAPGFYDIDQFLKSFGYSFFAFYDLCHASDGQLHQADALYVCPSLRDAIEAN